VPTVAAESLSRAANAASHDGVAGKNAADVTGFLGRGKRTTRQDSGQGDRPWGQCRERGEAGCTPSHEASGLRTTSAASARPRRRGRARGN